MKHNVIFIDELRASNQLTDMATITVSIYDQSGSAFDSETSIENDEVKVFASNSDKLVAKLSVNSRDKIADSLQGVTFTIKSYDTAFSVKVNARHRNMKRLGQISLIKKLVELISANSFVFFNIKQDVVYTKKVNFSSVLQHREILEMKPQRGDICGIKDGDSATCLRFSSSQPFFMYYSELSVKPTALVKDREYKISFNNDAVYDLKPSQSQTVTVEFSNLKNRYDCISALPIGYGKVFGMSWIQKYVILFLNFILSTVKNDTLAAMLGMLILRFALVCIGTGLSLIITKVVARMQPGAKGIMQMNQKYTYQRVNNIVMPITHLIGILISFKTFYFYRTTYQKLGPITDIAIKDASNLISFIPISFIAIPVCALIFFITNLIKSAFYDVHKIRSSSNNALKNHIIGNAITTVCICYFMQTLAMPGYIYINISIANLLHMISEHIRSATLKRMSSF